jgi:hypothetical protein
VAGESAPSLRPKWPGDIAAVRAFFPRSGLVVLASSIRVESDQSRRTLTIAMARRHPFDCPWATARSIRPGRVQRDRPPYAGASGLGYGLGGRVRAVAADADATRARPRASRGRSVSVSGPRAQLRRNSIRLLMGIPSGGRVRQAGPGPGDDGLDPGPQAGSRFQAGAQRLLTELGRPPAEGATGPAVHRSGRMRAALAIRPSVADHGLADHVDADDGLNIDQGPAVGVRVELQHRVLWLAGVGGPGRRRCWASGEDASVQVVRGRARAKLLTACSPDGRQFSTRPAGRWPQQRQIASVFRATAYEATPARWPINESCRVDNRVASRD